MSSFSAPDLVVLMAVALGALLNLVQMGWSLVDISGRQFRNGSTKPLWILCVIIVPILGSVFYLTAGRRRSV